MAKPKNILLSGFRGKLGDMVGTSWRGMPFSGARPAQEKIHPPLSNSNNRRSLKC
jgi:hypothetical protein